MTFRTGPQNPNWKGSNITPATGRYRARKIWGFLLQEPCEGCGADAHDLHHRDHDPRNNTRDNIVVLCRRCHMQRDGRRAALIKRNRLHHPMSQRTHCRHGHPFSEANTYRDKHGYRKCRQCHADTEAQRRALLRGGNSAPQLGQVSVSGGS